MLINVRWISVSLLMLGSVSAWAMGNAAADTGVRPENFFTNPSFEIRATDETDWQLDKAGATEAHFVVNNVEAAAGDRSACVTIGRVADWGTQFGQAVEAGQKGKTYTFAVLAKATQKPVTAWLQIERRAQPYDQAAASEPVTLKQDGWMELHVTFTVEKDFPEGWFAYISCTQSNCEYRADMFRLYAGSYVPYRNVIQEPEAGANVRVFDTGTIASMALPPAAISQRDGWKDIAPDKSCRSDVCVANGDLALVLRQRAPGAEYYYRLGTHWVPGPMLVPSAASDEHAQRLDVLRTIEVTPAKAVMEVGTSTATGHAVITRYIIRRNQSLVEVQPGDGMASLMIKVQSQYAVIPDIFGGDLVIRAAQTQTARLRLPSERVIAQLLAGGNAIAVCAWRSGDQGLKMTVSGSGEDKMIATTQIQCSRENNLGIWMAILAAPGIWCQQPIADLDPVKDTKLEWKVPFRALWRADFQRTDGLIDSWKCIIKKHNNDYEGFGVSVKNKSRTVWTSARGTFAYPACLDGDRMWLRNTKFEGLPEATYDPAGKVILYPFRRISGSPENACGVFDVLADALQNTPEAEQVDEMQIKRVPRDQYPATCAVTAEYEKIFADKEEQARKAEILQRLEAMDYFCIGIRSRMDEYLAWAKKTHAFCAHEKAAKPQIGALVDELDGIVGGFSDVFNRLKLGERTPAAARALSAKVRALIDSDADKKEEKADQLGRETRTIGGSQDESIGRFRTITRELRQRAGYRMIEAPDDDAFEFAGAMRMRTMELLQCAFGHEGAFTE